MAEIGKVRIRIPSNIKQGDVVRARALVIHPMERVERKDGKPIDKNYHFIHKVLVAYNGRSLMEAELTQSVSENPFFAFTFKAVEPGTLKIVFEDTHGGKFEGTAQVKFA